jgi:hypothetical protein
MDPAKRSDPLALVKGLVAGAAPPPDAPWLEQLLAYGPMSSPLGVAPKAIVGLVPKMMPDELLRSIQGLGEKRAAQEIGRAKRLFHKQQTAVPGEEAASQLPGDWEPPRPLAPPGDAPMSRADPSAASEHDYWANRPMPRHAEAPEITTPDLPHGIERMDDDWGMVLHTGQMLRPNMVYSREDQVFLRSLPEDLRHGALSQLSDHLNLQFAEGRLSEQGVERALRAARMNLGMPITGVTGRPVPFGFHYNILPTEGRFELYSDRPNGQWNFVGEGQSQRELEDLALRRDQGRPLTGQLQAPLEPGPPGGGGQEITSDDIYGFRYRDQHSRSPGELAESRARHQDQAYLDEVLGPLDTPEMSRLRAENQEMQGQLGGTRTGRMTAREMSEEVPESEAGFWDQPMEHEYRADVEETANRISDRWFRGDAREQPERQLGILEDVFNDQLGMDYGDEDSLSNFLLGMSDNMRGHDNQTISGVQEEVNDLLERVLAYEGALSVRFRPTMQPMGIQAVRGDEVHETFDLPSFIQYIHSGPPPTPARQATSPAREVGVGPEGEISLDADLDALREMLDEVLNRGR